MTRTALALFAVLLAACAAEQRVSLMPRGEGPQGTGYFDQIHQQLVVDLAGGRYIGTPITKTATTGFNIFGPQATTSTNEQNALLIGDAGQVRCEFVWNQWKTMANGVCVDSHNVTYDLLIRNP